MAEFRKKPVVIQAVQLNYRNWNDICDFVGKQVINEQNPGYYISAEEVSDTCGEGGEGSAPYLAFTVTTTHGEKAIVRHGDWVIPDSKPGTFYPCKPDIFAATYDEVTATEQEVGTDYDLSQFKALDYQVFPSADKTISVLPDPIYGGAHVYAIRNSLGFNPSTQQAETGASVQVLSFVHKPEGEAPMVEGLQSEQLAYVLLDRCRKLNARFPSPYNEKQLAGLELFLEGCRERVESRLAAGTMGQLKK